MVSKRIKFLDNLIVDAASINTLTHINPRNVASCYTKFKSSKTNPKFTYDALDRSVPIIEKLLKEIEFPDEPLSKVLQKKRDETVLRLQLLQAIGTDDFTKVSTKLFAPPDKELVDIAYKILKLPVSEKSKRIHRTEVMSMLKAAFKTLDLNWKIVRQDIVTSALVKYTSRQLILKKRERFYRHYVKRLIVHEIGTHAIRYENGRQQPLRVLAVGTANYLETEEGLAAYSELVAGVMSHSILRNYAGRVIAIHHAMTHDFKSTYEHMRKYFSDKSAWKLTVRVKRGLSNTSQVGAYTKDVSYLRGFVSVYKYAQKNKDLDALYAGKIHIKDIKYLHQHIRLVKPKYTAHNLLAGDALVKSSRRAVSMDEIREILDA